MKVTVELSPEVKEPYAVIHADRMSEEIQSLLDLFMAGDAPLTAWRGEEILILKPKDIYLVRIENGETILYGQKEHYRSRKRLYELSAQLGGGFMQISRSALVNVSYMDKIEPGFGGMLLLKLKNGLTEHVSRTYLPAFRRYLGL